MPVEDEAKGIVEANRLCQDARNLVFHSVKERPIEVEDEPEEAPAKDFDSFIPTNQ
jgi:hypothetical protein